MDGVHIIMKSTLVTLNKGAPFPRHRQAVRESSASSSHVQTTDWAQNVCINCEGSVQNIQFPNRLNGVEQECARDSH